MWPRVIEGMLGAWLLVSPFVFRNTEASTDYTLSVVASGTIVTIASLLSFWRPARYARFLTLTVSVWLTMHGYFSAVRPGPPAAQNELVVGLILVLFAIMPNDTNDVPEPWRARQSS